MAIPDALAREMAVGLAPRSARNPWWVVLGSLIATSLGAGPVMVVSFGVFLKPITTEFGWDRSTLASALLLATTLNALTTPIVGRLIDRLGVRTVTLPAIAFFCACMAAMSLMTPSLALLFALFGLWGVSSAGHGQLPYATAISRSFSRNRGLALSLGLVGLGIGTAIVPRLATTFIQHLGWRWAYVVMAGVTFGVAFTAVLLFLHPPREQALDTTAGQSPGQPAPSQTGAPQTPSVAELARTSWRFWTILVAVLLLALAVNGLMAHAVPLMTDRGITPSTAAANASVIGMATIFGRLASGYLIDRVYPPLVAAFFFCLPALGAVALQFDGDALLLPGLATIGMALGAEADLAGVLVSRYLGLGRFGEIFGYVALAFSFGVGLGPWLLSLCYDASGSYLTGLVLAAVCVIVAGALVGSLGPPPQLKD